MRPEPTKVGVNEVSYTERRFATGAIAGNEWVTIDGQMGKASYTKVEIEFVRREENRANGYAQEIRILYDAQRYWLGGPPFESPNTMSSAHYSGSRTLTMHQGNLDSDRLSWKFPSFVNTNRDLETDPVEDFSRAESADVLQHVRRTLPDTNNDRS